MSRQIKDIRTYCEAKIVHKLRKNCLKLLAIVLMTWLLASCNSTADIKNSSASFFEDSSDSYIDITDLPEEDIEDFGWREEFEDTYMEENMFYNRTGVDEERFFFRLSCIKNRPDNTSFIYYTLDYPDIMRNIYDYTGLLYGFYGNVVWVERNGVSTTMLISLTGNDKIVNCSAETDISVVEGDYISVFGTLYPSNYISTNEYGNQRIIDCPGLDIQDYWVGYDEGSISLEGELDVPGSPTLPQWQKDYWFGDTEYIREDTQSIILTEKEINGHPYTAYRYIYLEDPAKLLLFVRLNEAEQYYKPDKYTVIQLEYNQIRISSNTVDGSFIGRIGELDWELTSGLIGIDNFGLGWCNVE